MKTVKYVALLRGLNIGGHNLAMERLRQLFSELGLSQVRTYIQTGNVFFESTDSDRPRLTGKIERHLRQALGYEVPTFLRTVAELEATIKAAPFSGIEL